MGFFSPAEIRAQAQGLLATMGAAIEPPPELKISEWAEGRVNVPGETGTDRPGLLSWDGFEYIIEPLDRLHDDDPCRDLAFCGSAQIAKTFIGVIASLYYSTALSRPWGVALPSTDEVLKYNRTKWQPVVDATPELRRKIRAVGSRDEQGSTNTYKRFAGGYGQFFGAGSPKALQMISLCIVIYEETPNWEVEVGGRGDPRSQIRKRQLRWEKAGAKTFHNATPGTFRIEKGEDGVERKVGCPITADFEASDMRRLYLPCPHCADGKGGLLLRLDFDRMLGLGPAETPHFVCPGCGGVVEHRHQAGMVARCHPYKDFGRQARGGWIPTFPSADPANPAPGWTIAASDFEHWRARPLEGRSPGYHAWQVVSSAVDWAYIAKEWRDAQKGTEGERITFSQQILGEAYEIKLQQASIDQLLDKRDGRLVKGLVPEGFEILTGAVDLNGDWAQWSVYAWGPGGEHALVDRDRIDGAPSDPALWQEMARLVRRRWPHEDGGELAPRLWGVDSGYGTYHVYRFCKGYNHARALDGLNQWRRMPLKRGPIQKLQGGAGQTPVRCRTWQVGTWDLKRELLNDVIPLGLNSEAERLAGKPHWPMWVDRDYFEELTAEVLVDVIDKHTGVVKDQSWARARRRNEEMDLWVYNAALAKSLGIGVRGAEPDWLELARVRRPGQGDLEDLLNRPTGPKPAKSTPSAPAAPAAPAPNAVRTPAGDGSGFHRKRK